MKIQIDSHTLERAEERGTSEEEIKDVLETGLQFLENMEELGRPRSMRLGKIVMENTMNKNGLRLCM